MGLLHDQHLPIRNTQRLQGEVRTRKLIIHATDLMLIEGLQRQLAPPWMGGDEGFYGIIGQTYIDPLVCRPVNQVIDERMIHQQQGRLRPV